MNRRGVLFAIAAFVVLAACTRSDSIVEPTWGKQPCAHCQMILSDARFGGQVVTDDGDRYFFDDVGCMVLFLDEHHLKVKHAWVRDATSASWLDAKSARYASGAATPMDFGFEARSKMADGVAWDDMRSGVLAKRSRNP